MLDKKDKKILSILLTNSKLSTSQISKKTAIPITTVHHRIKKLESLGVIKGYTLDVDYSLLDAGLCAYVSISVDYSTLKGTQGELASKLLEYSEVYESSVLAGGSDILLKVRCSDVASLNTFVTETLRSVSGIEKTQTMIVLNGG